MVLVSLSQNKIHNETLISRTLFYHCASLRYKCIIPSLQQHIAVGVGSLLYSVILLIIPANRNNKVTLQYMIEYKDFLKKFSGVDSKFVDDFFYIIRQ